MNQGLEWTELDGFSGRVLLVRGAASGTIGVYEKEADARSEDADSRALAVLRDDLLNGDQLAMADRNRRRLEATAGH